MATVTDDELYVRGAATLLASWEAYARGSIGATLSRSRGVAAGVFPRRPQRDVYNNALLERGLGPAERVAAVGAMEAVYASAGIESYAAWVHERDAGMRAELGGRGYTIAESTRAMGMSLESLVPAPTGLDLGEPDRAEALRIMGVPVELLSGTDPDAFRILVARLGGRNVATAMAFDHDGDCGVFNVTTLEAARRRGLGTALTARLLHDAREHGCTTASLQSTPMAERVYAAVGFRDLGRILEFVPSSGGAAAA